MCRAVLWQRPAGRGLRIKYAVARVASSHAVVAFGDAVLLGARHDRIAVASVGNAQRGIIFRRAGTHQVLLRKVRGFVAVGALFIIPRQQHDLHRLNLLSIFIRRRDCEAHAQNHDSVKQRGHE